MKKGEKIFSIILILFSLAFFIGSFFIVPVSMLTADSAGGYPIFIAALCLVLSLVTAFGKRPSLREKNQEEKKVFDPVIVTFMILLIVYAAAIIYIHYVPATLLFLAASVFYLKRDWKQAALVSYMCTFMILLIFKYLFSVIMP